MLSIRSLGVYLLNSITLPSFYYFTAAVMAAIVFAVSWNAQKNIKKSIAIGILTMYLVLILASTLFVREQSDSHTYEVILFWSYFEIFNGNTTLIYENLLNILMMFPLGILLPFWYARITCKQAAFAGFGLSLFIEVTQLFTKRGLFEFDDMFHNTLGCICGYLCYRLINFVVNKSREKD